MNKAEFLERQRRARAEWDALLAQVGPERMVRPGAAGCWSVKDVVAHVAWFEREMVGMLRARALEGSDLWDLDQDARNAVVYEQNRDRPLDDVLAEARQVYAELLPLLEGMSEEEYTDAWCFRGMPPAWAPWSVIAGNTWEHYEAHMPAIRAALEVQSR